MIRRKRGWIRAKFEDGVYRFFFCTLKGNRNTVWTMRVSSDRKVADRHKEFALSAKADGKKANKWISKIDGWERHIGNWLLDHSEHLKKDGRFIKFL